MSEQSRLKLSDVRKLFRLIGDIRQVGQDPDRWRPLMLQGLGEIVDAEILISSEVHAVGVGRLGKVRVVDRGWGLDRQGQLWRIENTQESTQPADLWLAPVAPGTAEDELLSVRPLKRFHPGRCFMLSQCPLPHVGAVDQLGLHRTGTDAPFTPREHRLLRLFHMELARFWQKKALEDAVDPTAGLPPRLRQTLDGLVSGDSEKQIALRLQLSRHTIHNYVKALHRRYQANSRGELLAKVNQMNADNAFRPRLSLELPAQPK
jgi:DNA-binding CsgD family transcriptional regulator